MKNENSSLKVKIKTVTEDAKRPLHSEISNQAASKRSLAWFLFDNRATILENEIKNEEYKKQISELKKQNELLIKDKEKLEKKANGLIEKIRNMSIKESNNANNNGNDKVQ